MAEGRELSDIAVFARLYELFRDAGHAGPGDWNLDLAAIDELVRDLATAGEFAESDLEFQRAQEALDAARALHRSLEALAATPRPPGRPEPPT